MKKAITWFLAAVLILALFAGCTGKSKTTSSEDAQTTNQDGISETASNTEESPTVITIWVNGGEDAYIPCVADAFMEAYPDIKLDLLLVPQEESLQKIMTAISTGGTLPDIVDINLDNLGQLLNLDLWENLAADPYNFDVSQLLPYMPGALRNEKGELVSLMADLTTCGVAYDRNLALEYFGTDDPDELGAMFSTNQAYIDLGKQVTEQSGGTVYTFASAQDAWGMLFAEYVEEPFVKDGVLNIDNSIGECFKFVENLQKNGSLNLYEQWSSEWINNISDSSTLFYSCPLWFVDWGLAANDATGGGRWGVMSPPSGSTSGGEIFLIPKASAPEKKQAAYTFINWLCATPEGARALYENTNMLSGYAGNLSLSEDEVYYSISSEAYGGQNVLGKFIDIAAMDSTKIRPLTKYDSGIFSASVAVLSDLSQGLSAEDALQQVKETVQSKYPELTIQ